MGKLVSGPMRRRGAMGTLEGAEQIFFLEFPPHLIMTYSQNTSKAPLLPEGEEGKLKENDRIEILPGRRRSGSGRDGTESEWTRLGQLYFVFDQPCIEAFQELKIRLTSTSILQAPNWEYSFELMCDASNLALEVILGQRVKVGKQLHVITYASRNMDLAQLNYTTTEKELLANVFALDKFHLYLLGSKIIIFSDHATLRFLLKKPDAKPRLIRWILLLQEFDIKIRDKKSVENSIANHLSRIERENNLMLIRDDFPNEQLLQMDKTTPWFADTCNFIVASKFPPEASKLSKEKIESDAKYYIWDDPYSWRLYNDQVIRRCISDSKI
ncbi:Retrovirus-related Pol polyprotein, partial [Mucuna pruriens]